MAKTPIEALKRLVEEIENGEYVWRQKMQTMKGTGFYTLQPTVAFRDAVETIKAEAEAEKRYKRLHENFLRNVNDLL